MFRNVQKFSSGQSTPARGRKEGLSMTKNKNEKWRMLPAALLILCICTLCGCGSRDEQGPVVITYGTLHLDIAMENWIASWNQSQDAYRVEVKVYEDSDTGRTQLNNEIVAGKGPDLLDLSDINLAAYADKGILEDMYPYLDKDGRVTREMLMQGVMQSYEFEGKLCGLPMGYSFETLLGKKASVGDVKDWTTDKMLELMQGLKEGQMLMDALSPEGFLRAVFAADMVSYVDMAEKKCYFEDEKFRKLLETAAGLNAGILSEEDHAKGLAEGTILLERAYVSDVSSYLDYCGRFGGEEVSWVGFPSSQGGKAVIYTRMPVGICAFSSKKDAAWEFVVSLLGDEFQEKYVMFLFPIRISALEKSFEAAKTAGYDVGFQVQEQIPATQEQIDALTKVISSSKSDSILDANIWQIVSEEASTLFEQGKDMDEVIRIIQNRAANYVHEQE